MDTIAFQNSAPSTHFGVGAKVIANGYPGVIVCSYDGDEQLDGMVDVKLEAGEITVPRYELQAR